ncbi:hypothetical protein NC652_011081, partial [Populus alba x Populus x berolinensis]
GIKFYPVFIKPGDNAVEYSENHLICLTFLSYLPSHAMPLLTDGSASPSRISSDRETRKMLPFRIKP